VTTLAQPDVDELHDRIAALVRRRQELRATGASGAALERNRLELVQIQWDLCRALIARRAQPLP
jgi:hypothetical protein